VQQVTALAENGSDYDTGLITETGAEGGAIPRSAHLELWKGEGYETYRSHS
jgi:hypothetical protein